MAKPINTRDLLVGDRIDLPGRGVIVTANDASGVGISWFTPQGVGPYHATLPHGTVYPCSYHDERNGEGESYWDTHPDFTGKTGEV